MSGDNDSEMLRRWLACGIATLVIVGSSSMAEAANYIPRNGFVPDARTAIKIAEAVLMPIYGEKTILRERPFHASLDGNHWVITGSLHPGETGGVAVVRLDRADGHIFNVQHGR
ncbi:MAG: YbbC/YhhH family protein [Alphaproteobacteria bacterium]|nr:YbbC/YhhH family protein [Alphaproteobacteria bacterium]